eukprot:TRINITY_DN913_c1_g2_i2.p1 TRINITY_DN913_c1_g2~~TRINITY_DN913_c1_g2_i2.p1  ORF type:complete len:750 (-),score=153.56 TRINITY_DN913_c1_g2_i2:464-2632(-)
MAVFRRSFGGIAAIALLSEAARNTFDVRLHDTSGLRLLATSFNAGNENWDKEDPDHIGLAESLAEGHEEPSFEADLVMVGLQEFKDTGYTMAEFMQRKVLWKKLSQEKLDEIKAAANSIATPTKEVTDAQDVIRDQIFTFRKDLLRKVEAFKSACGSLGSKFHSHVAAKSPALHFTKAANEMTASLSSLILKFQAEYKQFLEAEHPEQFRQLKDAINEITSFTKQGPEVEQLRAAVAPVTEWSRSAFEKLEAQRSQYPNLKYSHRAKQSWATLLEKMKQKDLDEAIWRQHHETMTQINGAIAEFETMVEGKVEHEEDVITGRVQEDIANIRKDVDALTADLAGTEEGVIVPKLANVAKVAARGQEVKVEDIISKFEATWDQTLNELDSVANLNLHISDVQVAFHPQKYDSGTRCHWGSHFDTSLYVFTNPWSPWRIQPVQYGSQTCEKRKSNTVENPGCSIENNQGFECGKVVNLMVLQATHKDAQKTLRVCALNTHMSFAGTAAKRLEYMYDAFKETEQAKCDSVVFVGDFNSRLHCASPEGATAEVPAYEDKGVHGTSFNNLLANICQGDRCSLAGSPQKKWDELYQMLTESKVICYEKGKNSKGPKWEQAVVRNPLGSLNYQVKEAATPDFAPTYKFEDINKVKGKGKNGWYKCLEDEKVCLINKAQDGKHNPAFTDRIIMSANSGTFIETIGYYRRLISQTFKSDHLPVAAQILIKAA